MNRNEKSKTAREMFEGLEARQLMAAQVKGSDVRIIANVDGTKDNGNDVIVKFNQAMGTVDASKLRMFGYSYNTLNGGQTKSTIRVTGATVVGSTIVIRTDVQVRKGANITFQAGAVTAADASALPVQSIRTTKGLNRDRFTLALRSFRPTDKSYFSSAVLTGGSTPQTANSTPNAATVRPQLEAFLNKKVTERTITAAQVTSTLARFDAAAVVALVPAANLRAAILSLVGTVGEPAIAFYLDHANSTGRDFTNIDFNSQGFSSGAKINETSYTSKGRLRQLWNPNYAGENFVVLSGLIAHEVVHEGLDSDKGNTQTDSQDEEVIANFIENVIYAQQVVTDFTYAQKKTTLALRANYRLLETLNSGDRQFPRVGIKAAPLVRTTSVNPGFLATDYDTRTTLQGKPAFASLADDVRAEFTARGIADKTPLMSYPTARTILSKITGNTYTSATTYGKTLIDDVDISQDTLADSFVMRAARVLQVEIRS